MVLEVDYRSEWVCNRPFLGVWVCLRAQKPLVSVEQLQHTVVIAYSFVLVGFGPAGTA